MSKFGKKVAIANADHDYAKAWTALFKPAWEAAGGTVVADNPMSYNKSTDFYSGVSKALADKPDVLFIGGASEPTGLVAKQARELGFKGGFIIMDQAKMNEMKPIVGGYGCDGRRHRRVARGGRSSSPPSRPSSSAGTRSTPAASQARKPPTTTPP